MAPPHVLVFPYPSHGHLIPILDLAHSLAARGVIVTVVSSPSTVDLVKRDGSPYETLVLPVPDHDGSDVKSTVWALSRVWDDLIGWFRGHVAPPVAIVSDMFLGWTHRLADRLRVPRVVFSPSGALALSTMYFLWTTMPVCGEDLNDVVSYSAIPNCPKYPWRQVSPLYRSYVASEPKSEMVREGFRANVAAWGLVVNTVNEFERVYLDHLRRESGHGRVFAVGPLLPREEDGPCGGADRGGPSSVALNNVLSWLDTCQDNNVVYVCFGSQVVLNDDQASAVANALEESGVRFVWSVGRGDVPDGFEDRVGPRGMVIRGWAPQVLILRHRAVTAFVTHCGWNSLLEAVTSGVAMLTWPMGADQYVDADLLVEEMKVAIRVSEGSETVPDSGEFARVLIESVSQNSPLRERVDSLRNAAAEATEEGGSSAKDLDEFVKQLTQLKPQDYKDNAEASEQSKGH